MDADKDSLPALRSRRHAPGQSVAGDPVVRKMLSRAVSLALLGIMGIVLLAVGAWPVRAAIELDFFDVSVASDRVTLEWATLSEFNLEGFNIYCKEAQEPPSAYHIIGTVPAQGAVDVGHFYTFPVTVLDPGVAYCFRIEEITTDGTAPEQFERCGYGLNIIPTPTLPAGQGAGVVENTPQTPGALQGSTSATPQGEATPTPATIRPAPDQPTPTPVAVSPLGSGVPTAPTTAAAAAGAAQNAGNSPLNEPDTGTVTGSEDTAGSTAPGNANESPLALPTTNTTSSAATPSGATPDTAPDTTSASVNDSPLATPAADASASSTPTATPMPETGGADTRRQNPPPNAAQAQGLPTPLYIVLTATPTAVGDALALAPTMTPLPTATAASATLLTALTEVNAESILLATLCLVFLGGSGLGILGITSLGLYLRSRSDSRPSGSVSNRRRNW